MFHLFYFHDVDVEERKKGGQVETRPRFNIQYPLKNQEQSWELFHGYCYIVTCLCYIVKPPGSKLSNHQIIKL